MTGSLIAIFLRMVPDPRTFFLYLTARLRVASYATTNLIFVSRTFGHRFCSSLRSSQLHSCSSYIYEGESTRTFNCPPEMPVISQCWQSSAGSTCLQASAAASNFACRGEICSAISCWTASPNLIALSIRRLVRSSVELHISSSSNIRHLLPRISAQIQSTIHIVRTYPKLIGIRT